MSCRPDLRPAALFAVATALAIGCVACSRTGESAGNATGSDVSPPVGAGQAGAPDAAADAALDALRVCPADDGPWADAVGAVRSEGAQGLARLEALGRETRQTCDGAWQPDWLVGEAVFRGRDPARAAEALDAYTAAAGLARRADDDAGIARSANRIGWILDDMGRDAESFEAYGEALAAAERAGRDDLRAYVLGNRMRWYERRGRYAEADADGERTAEALRRAGRLQEELGFQFNRALQLQSRGDLAGSREIFLRIHEAAVAAGDGARAARCRLALGLYASLVGDAEAARDWYGGIAEDDTANRPFAELGLGRVALDAGHADEAAKRFASAAGAGDALTRLRANVLHGEALLRLGRADEALGVVEAALSEAESTGSEAPAYMALATIGKIRLARPDGAGAAVEPLREAVRRIEAQGVGAEDLGYLRERLEPYADLAAALAASGRPDEVFEVMESAHARALRRASGQPAPPPEALATLRDSLPADEALVDLLVGRDRGAVLAVSRRQVIAAPTPGWSELRPALTRWRAALRRPLLSAEARLDPSADLARDRDAGEAVRRALLDPVDTGLAGVRRLWIVPDQDLSLLPFAALPAADGAGWLGDRFELARLPLAGRPAVAGDAAPVLLAGDPRADAADEFPVLPLAAGEIRALSEVWGNRVGATLTGDRLTGAELLGLDLARFGTIHLATHAVASTTDPARCAVVLSGGERLGLRRIAELHLGPALVVLSACRTGEGEVVPGEGVVGLTWAFLDAGAGAVAASLWSVEDESTAELMAAFHTRLRAGDDAVAALTSARREVAARRPHPAWWAPFVLVVRPQAADDARTVSAAPAR